MQSGKDRVEPSCGRRFRCPGQVRVVLTGILILQYLIASSALAEGTPESFPAETAQSTLVPTEPAVPPQPVQTAPPSEPVLVPTSELPPTQPQPLETTEPTLVATAEPTAESTLTETAEAAPTQTPAPAPTAEPTPTPEPAIPFDPNLECVSSLGSSLPVAGDLEWAYLDCTIDWQTKNVSGVSLLPVDASITWDVVALNDRAIQSPNQLVLDPQSLPLVDADLADAEFSRSQFHLAMRVSCVDDTAVTIPLQFQATSGENALQELATEKLPMSATAATLPVIELTAATFGSVEPANGNPTSTGVISMNYSNASESCGWKITTSVNDFVAPDGTISASSLVLIDVNGPAGLTSSIDGGAITLYATPGFNVPTNSTITITVSLLVPETVPSGVYATTVSAEAGAP